MWSFEGCSLNGRWVRRFWPLKSSHRDLAERVMLGHMSQEQEELVEKCENHKPPPPSRPVARLRRGSGALCFSFLFSHWHPVSTVKRYKHTPVLQWQITSWSWLYNNNNGSVFTAYTIYMTVIAVVWLPYLPADTVLILMIGLLSVANSSHDDETAQQCLPDNILRLQLQCITTPSSPIAIYSHFRYNRNRPQYTFQLPF